MLGEAVGRIGMEFEAGRFDEEQAVMNVSSATRVAILFVRRIASLIA